MVEDGSFSYVKPAEVNRSEEDVPDVVSDLFEPDVVFAEQVRDVDTFGGPANASVARDLFGSRSARGTRAG